MGDANAKYHPTHTVSKGTVQKTEKSPVVIQRQKPSSETAQSCMSWSDVKGRMKLALYVEGEEMKSLLDGRGTRPGQRRDSLMTKSENCRVEGRRNSFSKRA